MAEAPVLVAMCGIPFAGKSTLARELAARCGYALVSVDAIVGELGIDVGVHADNHHGWARAMAEGFSRTRRLLAEGRSVIYDNANHSRRNRDRCRRIATQAGARFRIVWVDIPPELAWERLLANRDVPIRGNVPDAGFREIAGQFESPAGEPDVVRVTPATTIDELMLDVS